LSGKRTAELLTQVVFIHYKHTPNTQKTPAARGNFSGSAGSL